MTENQHSERKFSILKILRLLVPVGMFILLCVVMCVPVDRSEGDGSLIMDEQPAPDTKPGGSRHGKNVHEVNSFDSVTRHLAHLDTMPSPTVRMKVNYFGNLRQVFNDSNHLHLSAAEQYGILPLSDTRSHWNLRRPIVKITTCEDYFIDTLIFSRPYLVPEAAATLREIGRRFRDTIAARGGGDYRIKVTSLLRTPQTIKRLRRRNRNAIDSSVHRYGTTFDISYANFVAGSPKPARSVDDLKGVLAEVLKAMREEGKLWVKYERGQPCFHITARKPKED